MFCLVGGTNRSRRATRTREQCLPGLGEVCPRAYAHSTRSILPESVGLVPAVDLSDSLEGLPCLPGTFSASKGLVAQCCGRSFAKSTRSSSSTLTDGSSEAHPTSIIIRATFQTTQAGHKLDARHIAGPLGAQRTPGEADHLHLARPEGDNR